MSGSDITSAGREAAMVPIREYIKKTEGVRRPTKAPKGEQVRGLQTEDISGIRCNDRARARSGFPCFCGFRSECRAYVSCEKGVEGDGG